MVTIINGEGVQQIGLIERFHGITIGRIHKRTMYGDENEIQLQIIEHEQPMSEDNDRALQTIMYRVYMSGQN